MFCRCFCPGTLRELKKDIQILYSEQNYYLKDVVIKKCANKGCKDGTIPHDTWEYITSMVGPVEVSSIEAFRLSRIIFAAFKE